MTNVLISQLESSLAEKRKTLASVQGLKSSLEEQLRELTTTKVRGHSHQTTCILKLATTAVPFSPICDVCLCVGGQTALEAQALDEKDKAQRLQTELDVSEQVQRDFVKLSQTLQVRTAGVPWQPV